MEGGRQEVLCGMPNLGLAPPTGERVPAAPNSMMSVPASVDFVEASSGADQNCNCSRSASDPGTHSVLGGGRPYRESY